MKNQSSERRSTKDHTLSRFAFGALNGVPSRFSALFFPGGKISSRIGRTFKSAYFLQFVPQVSQRRLVARPLGARHQLSDSRVRQAPQLVFALVGPRMVEPSSSDMGTSTVSSVSSVSLTIAARSRVHMCSSFSMELASSVKKKDRHRKLGNILFPVAVKSDDLWHRPRTYFVTYRSEFWTMKKDAILKSSNLFRSPFSVSISSFPLLPL
jgi:hypothetical protein